MRSRVDVGVAFATLALSGLAAYAFLAIAAHALGPSRFAPVGTLWAIVFLATSALSAPLETELARRIGASRGRAAAYAQDIRAAARLAVAIGIVAMASTLMAGAWLDAHLFGGANGFAFFGSMAFAGLLAGGVAKGTCAGAGRLAWWGTYLVLDGGSRCVFALLAAALAPTSMSFAIALALGPWLALLGLSPVVRALAHGPRSEPGLTRELAVRTSPLIIGAGAAAGLTYLGAVALPVLVHESNEQVGSYQAALALGRLPLFAFSPVVAFAVPRVAFATERGDRRRAGQLAAAITATAMLVGGVGVVTATIFGAALLGVLFGAGFTLPMGSLVAVAVAAACWLVATAAGAATVGAGRASLAAAAWLGGLVIGVATLLALGPDPYARVDDAMVGGGAWALLSMLGAVTFSFTANRRHAAATGR